MKTAFQTSKDIGSGLSALTLNSLVTIGVVLAVLGPIAALPGQAQEEVSRAATATTPPVNDGFPEPGFAITADDTAIVITDPQNDFLSPDGVTWGVVGQSITANGTVDNLGALFQVAEETGMVTSVIWFPMERGALIEHLGLKVNLNLLTFVRRAKADATYRCARRSVSLSKSSHPGWRRRSGRISNSTA